MRNVLFLAFAFACIQPAVKAQVTLVPAGTLLHCSMDDPNFSTKTAEVGDPVLCHLSPVTEFGRPAFPRGSYLAGHLESAKEPGHFVGKGYMKIVFDRIGLPDMDAQLNAKMVAARGQKVNRQGAIIGHGHAKRDVAEWMIPPLWPWKVITLPARGPQPRLKDEETITLRLMEDVEVPRVRTYSSRSSPSDWHHFGDADAYANAEPQPQSYVPHGAAKAPESRTSSHVYPTLRYVPPSIPAMEPPAGFETAEASLSETAARASDNRFTLVALKSDTIYPVTDYWIGGGLLSYTLPDGTKASTDINDIDWQRTTDVNAQRGMRVTLRTEPRKF